MTGGGGRRLRGVIRIDGGYTTATTRFYCRGSVHSESLEAHLLDVIAYFARFHFVKR